ncbi:MarR family winged helix-turn-helix transcriptional regulator [Chloroflexota bacterium]
MSPDLIKDVAQELFTLMPIIMRGLRRRTNNALVDMLDSGITPAHLHILGTLRMEGTLNMSEIGQKLLIRGPRVTYLIDNLVEQEMIERIPDPNDRRVINIILKDKGKKIFESHEINIIQTISASLSVLSENELKELSTLLRNLKGIFSKLE